MGLATISAPAPAITPRKWVSKSSLAPPRTLFGRSLEERNRILIEHLPQVRYIAGRIHNRLPQHVPLEDLVNSGMLGLMEALEKYDPTRNVQLKSYAKVRIRGAILDSLRELDWSPRTLRRKARLIEYANQHLRTRFGRAPADTELAAEMGMSLRRFQHLLGDLHGLEIVSLQAMGPEDGHGDESLRYPPHSSTEDPASACLRSEMNSLLGRALSELAARKRQVLALYYFEELTMKEVGARLGVGESRVSQIHTAALSRLRARMRQLLEARARVKSAWPRPSSKASEPRTLLDRAPDSRLLPPLAPARVAPRHSKVKYDARRVARTGWEEWPPRLWQGLRPSGPDLKALPRAAARA